MIRLPENAKISAFKNNCTLIAVKEVSGLEDHRILNAFLSHGYRPHRGTNDALYLSVLESLGIAHRRVSTSVQGRSLVIYRAKSSRMNAARYISLGQFIDQNPKGVFLVRNPEHAFVIRNGREIDPNVASGAKKHLRRRIHGAWQILNPAETSTFADVVGASTYKLKRGEDPIVRFRHNNTDRRMLTKGYANEYQARIYIAQYGMNNTIRLSELTRRTEYNRSFAAWDLGRGILEIVTPK